MHIQSYEEIGKRRFREIAAGLLLIILLLSLGIGHASAKGVVQTVDVGFYDADQMKQPKNIVGENRWSNGTYSDSLVNKNNVKFSIKDKLSIEATLTISPTSGTWVYYPANISGNVISYTNARGRIAYEDQDTTLKETIILNAPVSSITWILNLSVKPQSLGFSVDADGYSIRDPANTDQRIHIPFPYVIDAQGTRRDLRYSWNNGQRRLTLTQDFAGLVYPLMIDPVFTIDSTGTVGRFPFMLVNASDIPEIVYVDSTNAKLKLAINNSGTLNKINLIGTGSGSSYTIGVTTNTLNDLPVIFHTGINSKSFNITWWSSTNWFSCETYTPLPEMASAFNFYPISMSSATNRLLIGFLNNTYGNMNVTRVEDLSGTSLTSYNHYIVPAMPIANYPVFGGAINASKVLNIVWSGSTRMNLSTVTDSNSPSINTILVSTNQVLNGTIIRYSLDIDPTTDFPGLTYIPYNYSVPATDTGRAVNFTYLGSNSHWFHELAYVNSSAGMSRIVQTATAYNSSGYAYIVFIEGASGSSTNTANLQINYIKRTAANTWTTPVMIRGGGSSTVGGQPSIAFDNSDGLHITWFNDTTDDLEYYFEPLPAAAGSAPVAAFSCTPIAGVRNATRTCTDASTNTPTSWAWWSPSSGVGCVLNGSLPANQNPAVFPKNFSYCGLCLTATNAFGSGSTCKANYLYTSQPWVVN